MRFTFALGVLLAGSALTEAAFTLKKKPAVRLKGRAHGAVPEDAAAKPAGAAAAAAAARTPAAPGSNIHLSAGASACSDHDVTCQSREHYEAYPYPRRDPAKEASDIMQTYGDELELLNYRIWGGHRDMNEPFRALVAGGGTGDATVWLARQLSPRNSENKVVHVDLSAASIDIARKRTEFAYVNDVVEFVQEDLLKLDPAKIGTFDYIQVSGVLHHLADPAAGLRVLKRLLKPGGGMGMMLYAKYGRTGVHDLQTMLKYIAPRNSKFDRIDMARTLFQNLPGTSRAKAIEYINKMITAETHSESGTYDLLLHSKEAVYTVPDVYELLAQGGMKHLAWVIPGVYNPVNYLTRAPAYLRDAFAKLPIVEQESSAELLNGAIHRHMFYALRTEDSIVPPPALTMDAIPCQLVAEAHLFPFPNDDKSPGLTYRVDMTWFHAGFARVAFEFKTDQMALKNWLLGDCESSFNQIFDDNAHKSLPGMSREEFFEKLKPIMHMHLQTNNAVLFPVPQVI